MMRVMISPGNTKLGHTMNLSMPPIVSCLPHVPCAKVCYAMSSFRRFAHVKQRWTDNYRLWRRSALEFDRQFRLELNRHSRHSRWFRWFVGGDIPDVHFLSFMYTIANDYTDIRFLCFTKRIDLLTGQDIERKPSNLTLIFSTWPCCPELNWGSSFLEVLPGAWFWPYKKPKPEGTPTTARECPGACETCRLCWQLTAGQHVLFHQHGNGTRKEKK